MAGRKVIDEEEARACLADQACSRLSPARWAQENGYDGRSINAWRMNLERRAAQVVEELNLVELVPIDHGNVPTVRDEVSRTVPAMTLRCGAFSIDVPATFDEGLLTELLRVMAAC
jgi:hypothetical protein